MMLASLKTFLGEFLSLSPTERVHVMILASLKTFLGEIEKSSILGELCASSITKWLPGGSAM